MRRLIVFSLAALVLSGCTTDRQTTTARTATEELLTSTAADRAATALAGALPPQTTVYLDTTDFDATDGKYAIAELQDALLRRGCILTDKKAAATIVAVRSGALAVNNNSSLIGIPALTLPIPLAGAVSTPQVAFYGVDRQQGVAKFAATAIDAKTGRLIASVGPSYGLSHVTHYTLLLFISWHRQDVLPKDVAQQLR